MAASHYSTKTNVNEWRKFVCPYVCKNWPMTYGESFIDSENGTRTCRFNSSSASSSSDTWNDDGQYQFSYVLAFVFGIPATFIIVVTVFGNLLVLCFKARVGKRQTTLLVWNLGLADFLVGIFVLPLGVSYVIGRRWMFGRLMCRIWTCCDVIFCTASIVTLCIISLDRYIGVTKPLRYKSIVTKTKVKLANVAIWIFSVSILLATVRYDDNACFDPNVCSVARELEYVIHSVIFAFFLPAFVTLLLYWKIYSVAKKREKGIMQGLMMVVDDNFLREYVAVPLRIHCGKETEMTKQQQMIKMHKKVAKTLGVVVSAFLMCWLPFFCLYLVGYHCEDCIPSLVLDVTTWLGYCNSCLNPLIYAYTISEFRNSAKLLLSGFGAFKRKIKGSMDIADNCNRPYRRSNRAYSLMPMDDDERRKVLARVRRRVNSQSNVNINRTHLQCEKIHNLRNSELENINTEQNLERDKTRTVQNFNVNQLDSVWSAKVYCTLIDPKATRL